MKTVKIIFWLFFLGVSFLAGCSSYQSADSPAAPTPNIPQGAAVSTLAGQVGIVGATNATGTAATFDNPYGGAVDASGNVYVADLSNQMVREITLGGVSSTRAGQAGIVGAANATGTAASFHHPQGVAVD